MRKIAFVAIAALFAAGSAVAQTELKFADALPKTFAYYPAMEAFWRRLCVRLGDRSIVTEAQLIPPLPRRAVEPRPASATRGRMHG